MFKTKVYVRLINGAKPFEITKKGDWIDCYANGTFDYEGPSVENKDINIPTYKIPLGFAMKLPKGYEAIVASRSSSYKTYGVVPWNCIGIIDNCYNGTNDQWQFGALCFKKGHISKGDRICQFKIQLSQKATMWQRLKWLFSNGKIEFNYVDKLSDTDRLGFGKGTGAR